MVTDCSKETLQAIIRGKVSPESIIHSDCWKGYDGLVDVGYDKHFRINKFKHFDEQRPDGLEQYNYDAFILLLWKMLNFEPEIDYSDGEIAWHLSENGNA